MPIMCGPLLIAHQHYCLYAGIKKISAQIPSGKLTGRAVLGQLVFFCACLYQRALQVKESNFEDISYVKEK